MEGVAHLRSAAVARLVDWFRRLSFFRGLYVASFSVGRSVVWFALEPKKIGQCSVSVITGV